jgi:hypothetical protein
MLTCFHEYSGNVSLLLKQYMCVIASVDRVQCARSVCIVSTSRNHIEIVIASSVMCHCGLCHPVAYLKTQISRYFMLCYVTVKLCVPHVVSREHGGED